jgi:hypothetical protein
MSEHYIGKKIMIRDSSIIQNISEYFARSLQSCEKGKSQTLYPQKKTALAQFFVLDMLFLVCFNLGTQ